MNDQKLVKLGEQTESLLVLLQRAYAQYLFLRPMMTDAELIARHGVTGKRAGFEGLRRVLYWAFILELVKLCDDSDNRTPSIACLRNELLDQHVVAILEQRRSRHTLPSVPDETPEQRALLQQVENEFWRTKFRDTHRRFCDRADRLLQSPALTGYKTVRDKNIAHNELRMNKAGRYVLFNFGELGLKFGDERQLLDQAKEVIEDLYSMVCGASFSWSSFLDVEQPDVEAFWEIRPSPQPWSDEKIRSLSPSRGNLSLPTKPDYHRLSPWFLPS